MVALLLTGTGASSAAAACYTGPFPFTNNGTQSCIQVANTSFSGNVINNASIVPGGITVTNSTIDGSIAHNGFNLAGGIAIDSRSTIAAVGTATAIAVSLSTFSGGISNAGVVTSGGTGVSVGPVLTFGGGITNSGSITTGRIGVLAFTPETFTGGIVNNGSISSPNSFGILAAAISTFSGGVKNSGTITARDGIIVGFTTSSGIATFSGGIANSGVIAAARTGIGVFDVSTFTGGIDNSGTISAKTGILLGTGISTFAGAIVNSGSITGIGGVAIDVTAANNPITINQMAGVITGAINLSANADVLNISGGVINSNVVGKGSSDTVNFALGTGVSTYSQTISGVNNINFNSGTTVLDGAINSGSGGVTTLTIAPAATLLIGNNTAVLVPNVTDNGVFGFSQPGAYTFGDTISGTGVVEQVGPGTTTLTGANAYSGGTRIDVGTLVVGNNSALGSGALSMANGTTLSFPITSNLTVANNIRITGNSMFTPPVGTMQTLAGIISDGSSAGTLNMGGMGTLTLTGTETYTGSTTVNSGALALGSGGSIASSSGLNLAAPGTTFDISSAANQTIRDLAGVAGSTVTLGASSLTLGTANSTAFAGVITGGGGLIKQGSGTLILTGANAYTGDTTVGAGMLQIGAGGTTGSITSHNATVSSGAMLSFDRSDSVSYSGSVSGSGGIVQEGSGTLVLNGVSNGFLGTTTVGSGTLVVGDDAHIAAALGGNVTVDAGASLRGHGTIGGNVVNGGIVQPGTSIGVLTVGGNYTQLSTGTLNIEVTTNAAAGPGVGYDQVRVGGTATLAGTLAVLNDLGTYTLGSRYTILTAGTGRNGNFATVAYDPGFANYIDPEVTYDASNVYLTLDPAPGATSSGQQVPDALTAMVSALEGVGDAVLSDVCSPIARRLLSQAEGCVARPTSSGANTELWMRGLGAVGSLTGSSGQMSFDDHFAGVLMGGGMSWGGLTVGVGGGYLSDGLTFSDGSSATQSAGLGFIYSRYEQGPLRLGAMAAYGGGGIGGIRVLSGTGMAANGDRNGSLATVQARASYEIPIADMVLEPRATLAYVHAGQSGFTENGASLLNLTYGSSSADVLEGRLVARVKEQFVVGTWTLTPWIEGGVQENFTGLSRNVSVTAGGTTLMESGISPAPTAAVVGVGVTVQVTEALDLFLTYRGLFSANQTGNAFSGGLSFRF